MVTPLSHWGSAACHAGIGQAISSTASATPFGVSQYMSYSAYRSSTPCSASDSSSDARTGWIFYPCDSHGVADRPVVRLLTSFGVSIDVAVGVATFDDVAVRSHELNSARDLRDA